MGEVREARDGIRELLEGYGKFSFDEEGGDVTLSYIAPTTAHQRREEDLGNGWNGGRGRYWTRLFLRSGILV
ncbi:unnamed protein product [Closterium sp. NIES-54]